MGQTAPTAMAELQDADLLLVQRGTTSYRVTANELLDQATTFTTSVVMAQLVSRLKGIEERLDLLEQTNKGGQ